MKKPSLLRATSRLFEDGGQDGEQTYAYLVVTCQLYSLVHPQAKHVIDSRQYCIASSIVSSENVSLCPKWMTNTETLNAV